MQALRGAPLDVTLVGTCSSAEKAVSAGYEQGRREVCTPDHAHREGHKQGASGAGSSTIGGPFQICPDLPALTQRYEDGYRNGAIEHCEGHIKNGFNASRALGGMGAAPPSYVLPAQCPPELAPRLTSEVQRGYREGFVTFCDSANLSAAGQSDGAAGRRAADTRAAFEACTAKQRKRITQTYSSAYTTALATFCAADQIADQAAADALAQRPARDTSAVYESCSKQQRKQIAKRYTTAYGAAAAKLCAADDIATRGATDGEAGRAAADVSSGFRTCDANQRKQIAERYATAYAGGLAKYCDLDRIKAVASKAALDGAKTSTLPAQFAVCVGPFPGVRAHYDTSFAAGRAEHVANACTFGAGVDAGRSDAARTNERSLAMPEYCDRAKFDQYQRGYLDGWKSAKAHLCNEIEASKQGVDDAEAGRPLSYRAPALCPAELHRGLLAAYTSGHRSVPPPSPAVATTPPPNTPGPASPAAAPPANPTAISWSTNASAHRGNNGAQLQLMCAATTSATTIWGTDVYTDDSSICSAAMHAGLIDLRGGRVMIEIRPAQPSYKGSLRYGVRSSDFGWFAGSFVLPDARPVAAAAPPVAQPTPAPVDTSPGERPYEVCVKWADANYQRGLNYADARDRANKNCRGVNDLEVAKYVYSVATRALTYPDAVDLALEASRKRLTGKLPELKYATEGYTRGLTYAEAVKRAIEGVAKVQRNTTNCLQTNFDAYTRSLTYADAMDKTLAQCALSYPDR